MEIDTPKRLAHLPLVMDVLRRMGVFDIIDRAIVEDPRAKVSTSECVAVILCGIFVGQHGLWRLRDRLAVYDMATIMQDPGFDLEEFTEERLGRALDDLWRFSLARLMTPMTLQTIEQYDLSTAFLHFDTTSLTFCGAYEQEDSLAAVTGMEVPLITYGYSKIRRPDLKQVMYGALVTADGGVPLWGEALDGNQSDNVSTAAFFQRVRSLVAAPQEVCCVADSKGWCPRVLEVVRQHGLRLLSRLPRTHRLHAAILQGAQMPELCVLGKRPQKDAPPEYYEIDGCDVEVTYQVDEQKMDGSVERQERRVPARALRVFSSTLQRKAEARLAHDREQEPARARKEVRKWERIHYACAADAEADARRHCARAGFLTLDFEPTVHAEEVAAKRSPGRPRKDCPPVPITTQYRVIYAIRPLLSEETALRLRRDATFVLIRTTSPDWTMSDEDMLRHYKDQYHCEHGFAWLKSTAAINPMFVEMPRRVAALAFLHTIGLMVWTLIQRTIRRNLKAAGTGLPYHNRKPSDRITTKFIFELFPQLQTITLTQPTGQREKLLVGETPYTRLACQALGVRPAALHPVPEHPRH